MARISFFIPLLFIVLATLLSSGAPLISTIQQPSFSPEEATIKDLQNAFQGNQLTSRQLLEFYQRKIDQLNSTLRAVIELNPNALSLADRADQERRSNAPISKNPLHGIPVLLKDNIATKDNMNTTAGSYALLKSLVPRNAFVAAKLIQAGAIILGKASLSEWSGLRLGAPQGWCARSGEGVNPYVASAGTCGSSSGPSVSVAANMAAVSLGTETDGSILCPASYNSVVGFKPTVGLTSRDGVIPISSRQDSVGSICRTVSDAVYVLDAIVGTDPNDDATSKASQFIPTGGYAQYLKSDGLKGKRLGMVKDLFDGTNPDVANAFNRHLETLRQKEAVVLSNLKIDNIAKIPPNEFLALKAEFKIGLNEYLTALVSSPVRTLADVIKFNKDNPHLEKTKEYGQEFLIEAQATDYNQEVKDAVAKLEELTRNGFQKLMTENRLDAIIAPDANASSILAIGGFPAITVPAGYHNNKPFGISFGGLRGSEPKLIEIAYGFEQATKIRVKPPTPAPSRQSS